MPSRATRSCEGASGAMIDAAAPPAEASPAMTARLPVLVRDSVAATWHHAGDVVIRTDQPTGAAFDAVLVRDHGLFAVPVVDIRRAHDRTRLIRAPCADILRDDVD